MPGFDDGTPGFISCHKFVLNMDRLSCPCHSRPVATDSPLAYNEFSCLGFSMGLPAGYRMRLAVSQRMARTFTYID
ncbi:hypothetical protein RE428_29360 [Marinobacter nanhaiticus D15-8W]|nr:hypothetical protein RE428_29360 [Marinobacter nanhaiticus D15-8W]